MMKVCEKLLFYFFIILSCSSCSAKKKVSKSNVYQGVAGHFFGARNATVIKSETPVAGRFMYNNFIELLLKESYRSPKIEMIMESMMRFENTSTVLVEKDKPISVSDNFYKFLPRANESFTPVWMTLDSLKSHIPFTLYNDKHRNTANGFYTQFNFNNIKFPHLFNYPEDVVDYDIYGDDLRYGTRKEYFLLQLPEVFFINTKYSDETFLRQNTGLNTSRRIPVQDSMAYFLVIENDLLLNPAFKDAYERSIKAIWELYLIGLKFETLSDTLICDDRNDPLTWFQYYVLFKRPHPIRGCPFNLDSQNVMTYLSEAYENEPLMYKSYFELILWQMYETGDFTERDAKGKKRSYLFTSKNPKYPGNYEVKFNIYEPYEFKVRKR